MNGSTEMRTTSMDLIAISYAKSLFVEGSREQRRALAYAERLGSYTVIVFTRRAEGYAHLKRGNLEVYPTHSRNRISMLIDAYRIGRRVLSRTKSQCVITSQDPFETSLIGRCLARAYKAKHHVQVHGSFFGSLEWRKESLINRIRYYFGRYVVLHARCIRVVSERIKRALCEIGVPEKNITVLPIQAEFEAFLKIGRRETGWRPDERCIILTAGRLAREKNIGLIIRAVATLLPEHPGLTLRVVGSGPEEAALKAEVQRCGIQDAVTFVPWVSSLATEMGHADIFALASNHEGYALVLVEAMASELPIVTTDVGCAGEVLKNGAHGCVVPVGDERAYREALHALVADTKKRKTLGANGRATVRENVVMNSEQYAAWWADAFSRCM